MNTINISQARQNLPQLINKVFAGAEFTIIKNNIPMAKLSPVKAVKKTGKRRILPGATQLFSHLKGSTLEIADELRKSAWEGNYDD